MSARFRYDPAVLERFPATRGGVLHATGLVNGLAPAELAAAYRGEQARVREQLQDTPLAEVPALAAWRRTFAAFGVKPTQYRSAAEALLRASPRRATSPPSTCWWIWPTW